MPALAREPLQAAELCSVHHWSVALVELGWAGSTQSQADRAAFPRARGTDGVYTTQESRNMQTLSLIQLH